MLYCIKFGEQDTKKRAKFESTVSLYSFIFRVEYLLFP